MALIRRFNSELPSYLEGFFGRDMEENPFFSKTGLNIPAVNILESNEHFLIELAAPGFKKEQFNIKLHNNQLTISSQVSEDNNSNKKYTKKEFGFSSFERGFTLPNSADGERIEASYENGILTIAIPKKEEAKVKPPKAIEVK